MWRRSALSCLSHSQKKTNDSVFLVCVFKSIACASILNSCICFSLIQRSIVTKWILHCCFWSTKCLIIGPILRKHTFICLFTLLLLFCSIHTTVVLIFIHSFIRHAVNPILYTTNSFFIWWNIILFFVTFCFSKSMCTFFLFFSFYTVYR